MKSLARVSTGLGSLDEIIDSLRIGDNVVWQVDDVEDYKSFVQSFVNEALVDDRKIIYMRFANHRPLVDPRDNLKTYTLDATSGFESFSAEIHTIITEEGEGAFYVFDCLSDLLSAWATDMMVGNFFLITCPYLFELNTVAYFALLRNNHSFKTIARIRETTQVLLDVYNCEKTYYVQPLKVWNRYSPTMFLPHHKDGERFIPMTSSLDATQLFCQMTNRRTDSAQRNLDYWDRLFLKAEELLPLMEKFEETDNMVDHLCRIMMIREPRMLSFVKEHFLLEDLLNVKARLIGTGFVGGKTVGMLLARKLLEKDTSFEWHNYLEPHDSFYIGSDVFYTYLVQNGWWKLRMEQKTPEGYFEVASYLKEKMLEGTFPDEIQEQFFQLIEYFGQSPIIVRSSSLLEDSFGNAFAGKYESIFCANQGTPERRYAQFVSAVRRIFASTMNENALIYRLQRGLEYQDEQMALLVQRVSGSYRKHYFFPDVAGVGVSYNTFVWKKGMDPQAGMLRLVVGLGTRAVDRVEGDYPRVVALDDPLTRPHSGMNDLRTFSQRDVDLIDVNRNDLQTVSFMDLMNEKLDIKLDYIAVKDEEISRKLKEMGRKDQEAWIITLDELLSHSRFVSVMQKMLKTLEKQYNYPVDIEFTVNFTAKDGFQVNLVQCRPLQTIGQETSVEFPGDVPEENLLFQMEGNFMGGSISQAFQRIIYVDPQRYTELPLSGKYDIARLIGELNRQIETSADLPTILIGPGRWGTTTPSLGVPVSFSEINRMSVLIELADLDGNLMPELSFGTHFFQDLVENNIFYIAIFPWEKGVFLNTDLISSLPNHLSELLPDRDVYQDVVRVYDVQAKGLRIVADVVSQKIMSYFAA